MRKILLLLILSLSVLFANAQDVAGDKLRIYKGGSIGEDGTSFPLDMNGNNITNVKDPINLLDAVNKAWFLANMSLTQPLDSLSITPLTESDITTQYTLFSDSLSYGGAFNMGLGGYTYRIGQATVLLYYNDNAYTIEPFDVLHLKNGALINGQLYPTPELADASDWEKTQGTLSIAVHSIAPNSFGFTVLYGVIKGGDTSSLIAGGQTWLSDDGSGDLTSTRPEFQSYAISMGGAFNSVAAPDGQIFVNITRDIYDTFNDGWDGAIRETFDFMTSSDGVTITGTLNNVQTLNDLTLIFSDGFYTFDTTPAATLSLVAGTATVPQINYIFIDKATKTLQTSTGSFPITEHAKVAIVVVLDAATTQAQGALRNQNTNDHIKKEDDNGHILHIAERIRQFNADWDSGVESTLSGTPSDVYIANTSGKVWQMHLQDFPVQDMALGDDIHVVNDPITAYRTTTNLNDITEYSDGSSWNNQWSNIVVWGVCNRSGQTSHLMVNLPSNGYLSEEDAFNDNENFTNYNIPKIFRGVGFLIGRFTIRRSAANFTYNIATGYLDLRGFVPNNTAGAGGGGASGITTFTALTDTPNSYIGFSGQAATVTALEDGLEFSPVVTSINGQSPTLGNYNITSTANKVGEDVTIGTGVNGIDAIFSVADNDNSTSNELQDLGNSKLNQDYTVTISNGTNTTLTGIARTGFLNSAINTSSLQTGGVQRIDNLGNFAGDIGDFSGMVSGSDFSGAGTNTFTIFSNTEGLNFLLNTSVRGFNFSNNNGDLVTISNVGDLDVTGKTTTQDLSITIGAVVDKVWTCTNIDGSGAWDDAAGSLLTLQDVLTNGGISTLNLTANNISASDDFILGVNDGSRLRGKASDNSEVDLLYLNSQDVLLIGNTTDVSQVRLSTTVSNFILNEASASISVDLSGKNVTVDNILKITPQASAPSSPSLGWIYVSSTDNHLYFYNGTTWVQLD